MLELCSGQRVFLKTPVFIAFCKESMYHHLSPVIPPPHLPWPLAPKV